MFILILLLNQYSGLQAAVARSVYFARGSRPGSFFCFFCFVLFLEPMWIASFSLPLLIGTPWPSSASELYLPRDRGLLVKLVPTFADRGCRVVSATDPHDRNLGFVDRSRY
jgi:hypothetical protein